MKRLISGGVEYVTTKVPDTFAQTMYSAYIFYPKLTDISNAVLNLFMPIKGKVGK